MITEARWRDLTSAIPEAIATAAMNDALPDTGSPAPWLIEGTGFFFSARARRSDRDLLPPALARRARPLLRLGFGVRYSHTPVGTYNELGGAIVYARPDGVFGHIPFLPVDSAATMRGGRENWALPKVLATFTGDPVGSSAFTAAGEGWSVSAQIGDTGRERALSVPRIFGSSIAKKIPTPTISGIEQVDATGQRGITGAENVADMRLIVATTRIRVSTQGSSELRRLFPDGSYRGGTIGYRGVTLGEPRPRG
ncbi:acetoacetate decarboxylase family protein [Williamsia phyllosphaerae]|uniref:Acetoacetate decarboxylase n=1 Tax=Williamsia phyllosphaerae TaxID=885042 RepID=A0ABQ1UEH8_9NOCA|nr:acetoacetate decarboxylase family protein [Williamsia phyllosphaerae]GGF15840.1 hypothetical protein GCM10007298_09830 [Williamsia phyllosphaerae]